MKANIKLMKTKPEVTDEEIRSYMNFENLIEKHSGLELNKKNRLKLITGLSIILLLGSFGLAIYLYESSSDQKIKITEEQTERSLSTLPNEKEEKKIPAFEKKNLLTTDQQIKKESEKIKQENKTDQIIPIEVDSATTYTEAEPIEGYQHLYEYFNRELKYPHEAIKDSVQGVSTISFMIGKNGKPEDIKIVQSLGPLFDHEAYRLIEQMPSWKPALLNGKPIRSKISIPLTFQIEKKKK